MKKILITINGTDRPGIISKVSEILYQRKCNLEDVSMTILEGQFAMMLTASVNKNVSVECIKKELGKIMKRPWDMNCNLSLLKGKIVPGAKHLKEKRSYLITAIGKDKCGIVYEISRVLGANKINITDFDSRILGGRKTNLYAMLLEVDLPRSISSQKLEALLLKVSKKLKIEINSKELERMSL